ncbi:MAG: CHASE2 domain-containing protein, partial [Microcoleaceae cyanobacterium]
MLQLRVQQIEQFCLFDLFWGQGQRLSARMPFPKDLIDLYQEWHRTYLNFYQAQRIESPELENLDIENSPLRARSIGSGTLTTPITDWHSRLTSVETRLLYSFHHWLRNDKLHEIRATVFQICQAQQDAKSVDLLIACSSSELAHLPWEVWEVGSEFGTTGRIRIARIPVNIRTEPAPVNLKRSRARVLAIIGQDKTLNFQNDLKALQEKLKSLVKIEMVGWQPGKSIRELETEIKGAITDEQGWDILFFAGHSNEAEGVGGELGIAPGRNLSIRDIEYQLEIAKQNGLQFALFNSCKGLNIAESLIDLGLNQVAVMREPIHNRVAQEFLLQFLENLAEYKDVQECLATTCRFLKVEKSFTHPSAYLIPSLFRYPNSEWFRLKPAGWKHSLKQFLRPKWYEVVALLALSVLSLSPAIQYQLLEQRFKIQSDYRQFTQQFPDHDPSLLLIYIESDHNLDRKYIAQLIEHTAKLNPKVVGLDYVLPGDKPGEDQKLEASLANARNSSEILYIFGTAQNEGKRLLTHSKFADPRWQGDMQLWNNGRYMTLLPLEHEQWPLPLSYLMALAYKVRESELKLLHVNNPDYLTDKLFSRWMRPSSVTQYFYRFYQYWFHPIIDFSTSPDRIYKSISAMDFLEIQLENPPKEYLKPVIFIVPGGYDSAGVVYEGEDNLPPPPPLCLGDIRTGFENFCRIFVGGEAHAYMFHHFLKQKPIIPIPDLWLLWLFALAGKIFIVTIEQCQINQKYALTTMLCCTLTYCLISLQLYISSSILLPFLAP